MKRDRRVIASTEVDRHGEQLPPEALRHMAEHFDRTVVPVNIEHDPRIPPVGRILGGEVERLDDNTTVLVADMELFEEGDEPEYLGDKKTMPLNYCPAGQFSVGFDRNLRSPEDQADIAEIARVLDTEPHEQFKKSLDPISVLLIVIGARALDSMANGFFEAIGSEGFAQLKAGLKRIFARRKDGEVDKLLIVSYMVSAPELTCEVELVLTNPSAAEIDAALSAAAPLMARLVQRLPVEEARIGRVVFTLVDGKVRLSQVIRRDAVPLQVRVGGLEEE